MNSAKPWNVWLWWAYLCLGAVATLWGAFFLPNPLSFTSIISDVASIITLGAIFGYVKQQPLGHSKVWLFLAPIVIAIQAALFIHSVVAPVGVAPTLVVVIVSAALFAPSIWVLYAYAFRSAHVWQSVHA